MDTARRKILQTLAAAGAVASVTGVPAVAHAASTSADDPVPEPIEGNLGATDPGPQNIALDEMDPDTLAPPTTDAGIISNIKFSFGVPESNFANLAPPFSRWIYPGQVPASSTPVSDFYGSLPRASRIICWLSHQRRQRSWQSESR